MLTTWKARAQRLKGLIVALWFACRDPRTPWPTRILLACIVGYAFSPIDLIPDVIPILGYLDDLILLPIGIALAIRRIPPQVWQDAQVRATATLRVDTALGRIGGMVVVVLWIATAVLCLLLVRTWL